ncbi:zinc finger protein 40-like isoform X1 [Acipenser ruthenus]|uniref:zinc finger protein 40-like isoform X1 n=1 Tax=Acipenser ruthenus TaxID=7906 RepID=UPI00145B4A03|nr:zinc finger protein 40-like isoform X1 [Acipenser ruthenus]XP_033856294.3 zinc finger protein 40-like isoform X1 [Acipenser ruthenus]XP_033856296.3 zinc finger protein 40-like isoform X1 [Acipenser ruthenus]
MPRTKQNNPKNLKDKIEEAQKELNEPEDAEKGINERGRRNTETIKGVKRKKVVSENQIKKNPKSPVKKPPQSKICTSTASKLKVKADTSSSSLPDPSNQLRSSSVQNGDLQNEKSAVQDVLQKKRVNTESIVETTDCERPMQAETPLVQQQSFDLCNGEVEDCQNGNKLQWVVADKTFMSQEQPDCPTATTSLSNENWNFNPAGSTCISNSASSSNPSASLEVLLKAMEPDLSSLTKKKSSTCGAHIGKPGLNDGISDSNLSVRNQSSMSQPEFVSGSHYYPSILQTVQLPSTKNEQAHNQIASHLQYRHASTGQQNSQQSVHFVRSSGNQHGQEKHCLRQPYSVADISSLTHVPDSSSPQDLHQSQPMVHTCQSVSASVPSSIQVPVTPGYNPIQLATVLNHGVEQMSNISVRDQKPKKQGKYVCEYCNRACAKPSVLLKHIRSHTGERPYPCVTCGFSFKTKSNLYKHKKSHAHAIKLGLVLRPDSSSGTLSQDSDKALSIHSDVDESGESEEESTPDERHLESESAQSSIMSLSENSLQKTISIPASQMDKTLVVYEAAESGIDQMSSEPKVTAALPKVVVYPVNVSPLRADSPKVTDSTPELATAQRQREFQTASIRSSLSVMSSLIKVDNTNLPQDDMSDIEVRHSKSPGSGHAQLQRQQATDFSQQQQGKCLLSPRSLGSTDSGYFSRSESADQTISPSPFVKLIPPAEIDINKNILPCPSHTTQVMASIVQSNYTEKTSALSGQMRPPIETKSLEERISKLISDNEAVVDDKQLDSVKPRRTSLSRRGSIDSPKSYIFKDSFQFDLKPIGRRTSSSSDVPKSPFTPTDKSKPVFLLSVPSQYLSMDNLPITRSNSMPTTPGYSTLPPNVAPPPHPLRGSQSFDDKIGYFCDDVFVSGPPTPLQAVHPRTLVRQTAIEDSSTSEGHSLASTHSVDESYHGSILTTEIMRRSKSCEQGSPPEKSKKSQLGRGTMYECETCRNRYRKLENFENHKKFYCSELHGPKSKGLAVRELEQDMLPRSTQHQIFHYRVTPATDVVEQTPLIRKRRKMKSVGDDDEPSPTESSAPFSSSFDSVSTQLSQEMCSRFFGKNAAIEGELQPTNIPGQGSQVQLVARSTEAVDSRLSPIRETSKERGDFKRQGSGISVIQHTNSLSRPSSFEKSESFENFSPVNLQDKEIQIITKQLSITTVNANQEKSQQTAILEKPLLDQQNDERTVPGESTIPVHQSRLVRQHNIQVPEILVTEEPDREQESQAPEQEKPLETFNWPQRSESLSKLPTEKLPPKKKRIRLAEMENSSADSSLESSLSRSLSRESSLSRCSSMSASFDRDEVPRAESPLKADCIGKSSEFRVLPVASNTLGVPSSHFREMRRATSEQISCTQPSVEVTAEYRSKSFDCGSISPTRSISPMETVLQQASAVVVVGVQVPLIERRRGPLVRQMSLNIGPESQQSHGKLPMSFKQGPTVSMAAVTHQRSQAACRSLMANLIAQHSIREPVQNKSEHFVQGVNLGSQIHVQQPPVHGLPHPWQYISTGHNTLLSQHSSVPQIADQREIQRPSVETSDSQQNKTYTPKYQLHVVPLETGQICMLPTTQVSCSTLPIINIQVSNEVNSKYKPPEEISSLYLMPQVHQVIASSKPNDQVNQSPGTAPVHNTDTDISKMSQVHQDEPQTLIHSQEKCLSVPGIQKNINDTRNSSASGSLQCVQKMSSVGLFPQQEPTASSKRMLSPANSLDIAMEKHQKRAKDEHGAACTTEGRSLNFQNTRAAEVTRQRKLMLVRQMCTTEPVESLLSDLEIVPQHQGEPHQDKMSSETSDNETVSPLSNSLTRISPGPLVSLQLVNSDLKTLGKGQERRSPVSTQFKPVGFQGQVKLASFVSVVNTRDSHRLSFPSLKTATSFTWCFLMKRKPLHVLQADQRVSAYSTWAISANNPNPLGLPTKVALYLFDSKQKAKKIHYTQAITTSSKFDILAYSSKLKNSLPKVCKVLSPQKTFIKDSSSKDKVENQQTNEPAKEQSLTKSEPARVRIFDGGYKSNEEYVYVRGRGRGKYICEECGIRCKKPSMLRKHIRTHTDVRPYHCNYCNFSFKTKGNLTKHMKSKAHSKKCMDMGVSVGLIEDQDTEESGDRGRYRYERQGSDAEDSEGPDDDDNDNEEEDEEDSQAESVLSTTPSVTASPQHHPTGSTYSESLSYTSAEEDFGITRDTARLETALLETLPKALLTQMTVSSATSSSPADSLLSENQKETSTYGTAGIQTEGLLVTSPKSPCRQMSIDYPEPDEILLPSALNKVKEQPKVPLPVSQSFESSEVGLPVDRSTQTTLQPASDYSSSYVSEYQPQLQHQFLPQTQIQSAAHQTHLFSHLPMHSQQPARIPYSMIPVGGIQLVPAGLAAYSTFVPIQAGPVQLTIPAVSVIHRTASPHSEKTPEGGPGTTNPMGVAEHVNRVLPCIPIGQVNVSGLQSLSTQSLQPLPALGLEAVNILGLTNSNIAPQMQPQGLTLNALGLQVLAANPSTQSSHSPQAHMPGLQILNITLPTLIPSVSPITAEGQGWPGNPTTKVGEGRPEQTPVHLPVSVNISPVGCTKTPQISPSVQLKALDPVISGRLNWQTDCRDQADSVQRIEVASQPKVGQEPISVHSTKNSPIEHFVKGKEEDISKQQASTSCSYDPSQKRLGALRHRNMVQYSDMSSDDEDRLIIET